MRRVGFPLGLGLLLACAPVGSEPPDQPVPVVTPELEPEPESEPEHEPAVVAEPEPEPELPLEPEPEPEPPPEPPWSEGDEPRILAVQPIVVEAAREHGVDPHLVNGVIWVESKFRPKARNRSGARGLMQLMPKTAKAIGRALERPARVYDPDFNVHAGTWYLARMLAKFDGDETNALAAYVRGPAKIRVWLEEDHPFPDSVRGFVDKVQRARRAFAAKGWPASDQAQADPPASTAADSADPAPGS